jgi:hypothetical protein
MLGQQAVSVSQIGNETGLNLQTVYRIKDDLRVLRRLWLFGNVSALFAGWCVERERSHSLQPSLGDRHEAKSVSACAFAMSLISPVPTPGLSGRALSQRGSKARKASPAVGGGVGRQKNDATLERSR